MVEIQRPTSSGNVEMAYDLGPKEIYLMVS